MNLFSQQGTNKNKSSNFILMLTAFISLAVGSVYGQAVSENNSGGEKTITTTTTDYSVAKQEEATSGSTMNFVLWFMGSKQDPNAKVSPSGENTKKQFITSGTAPNRLLIKAFLKKAVNFETATV
jgi:hypothetical protein